MTGKPRIVRLSDLMPRVIHPVGMTPDATCERCGGDRSADALHKGAGALLRGANGTRVTQIRSSHAVIGIGDSADTIAVNILPLPGFEGTVDHTALVTPSQPLFPREMQNHVCQAPRSLVATGFVGLAPDACWGAASPGCCCCITEKKPRLTDVVVFSNASPPVLSNKEEVNVEEINWFRQTWNEDGTAAPNSGSDRGEGEMVDGLEIRNFSRQGVQTNDGRGPASTFNVKLDMTSDGQKPPFDPCIGEWWEWSNWGYIGNNSPGVWKNMWPRSIPEKRWEAAMDDLEADCPEGAKEVIMPDEPYVSKSRFGFRGRGGISVGNAPASVINPDGKHVNQRVLIIGVCGASACISASCEEKTDTLWIVQTVRWSGSRVYGVWLYEASKSVVSRLTGGNLPPPPGETSECL